MFQINSFTILQLIALKQNLNVIIKVINNNLDYIKKSIRNKKNKTKKQQIAFRIYD